MDRLIGFDDLYLVPLSIATLLSIRSFIHNWKRPFKLISLFLILTIVMELLAWYWIVSLHKTDYWIYSNSNHWIYNSLIPIRFLLLFSYFRNFSQKKEGHHKVFNRINVLFISFAILNFLWIQTPFLLNNYTFLAAYIITIVLTLNFFKSLLKSEKLIELKYASEVWIGVGSFIYYTVSTPLLIAINFLIAVDLELASSLYYINDALNIIMYTFYAIAFLCKPKIIT